ncbi:hypothetical protein SAY87_026586 [Trapa incisa]|uniref:Nudix hydrolase domain-containing protein n=2 Tax=Trapa TaxID=22665 RepID=A0AAN7M6U0_TRANT|nr:hypothetical protein SAY87_026586 [Trapa incisa]KAK4799139.1 hypothetical protein SAY86_024504 [Trapa natans]
MALFQPRYPDLIIPFSSGKVKLPGSILPVEIGEMVSLVSRTGRHLQRYEKGCRQVVGCIPYRYRRNSESVSETDKGELEVLLISSQKGNAMMFPKGGWETDESMEEAALRETMEEAGVKGEVQKKLGKWQYKSNSQGIYHDGYMFPLLVKEQLEYWPEKNVRQRRWVSASEARDICQHGWMKEALDVLVSRVKPQQ